MASSKARWPGWSASSRSPQCEAYGFRQDDPRFPECLLQLDQADKQRRAAMAGAILMSRPQQAPAQPYQMPIPQTTTTNCTGALGQVNCTSVTR